MFVPNGLLFWTIVLVTFTFVRSIPYSPDLPPGPFCEARGCCDERQDECSMPILGTLCYCDEFCNRTVNDDCCPDFWSHCKGITPAPEPIKTCYHNGEYFYKGRTMQNNCNLCKCEDMGGRMEMLCENNACIIAPEILNTVNQMSSTYGWRAANHSHYWGRTLQDGITLRLGTLQPHRFVMRMNPVRRIYDPNNLPKQFDAETIWPGKIGQVQDQGWCGSSWAVSTAAVASDRYAVISKGLETPKLSAQNLLSCDKKGQQSCHGGHLDRAWLYVRKFGIVDEDCLPYKAQTARCTIPRRGNLQAARCSPSQNIYRRGYYKVGPAYRLGNETDIMFDILKSGPVQATMKVYHDFFMYSGGIYKHTDLSTADRTGYHSVRIVGWGQENDYTGVTKYWKVANSWGPQWGENGYFRIVRGTNECDIESFVLGTWPEIAKDFTSENV